MFKAARSNQQLRQPLKLLTKSSAGYCKKHCSHNSIRSSASNYPSHHKSQGIYLWNAKIPSQEVCIYQEMKILKILSLYHVWFRNYYHLRYGPFSLDTEPLKFLAFWNCFFYSAIFHRKQLIFGPAIHFHTIISKAMYIAKNFIKQVCGGVLRLLKLLLLCFPLHFQRAISWQGKIQTC